MYNARRNAIFTTVDVKTYTLRILHRLYNTTDAIYDAIQAYNVRNFACTDFKLTANVYTVLHIQAQPDIAAADAGMQAGYRLWNAWAWSVSQSELTNDS